MGEAQVAAVFPPTMASSQWRLRQWESPGGMAMAARQMVQLPKVVLLPVSSYGGGFPSLQLHNNKLSATILQ